LIIVTAIIPLIVGALAIGLLTVFSLQTTTSSRISDTSDAQMVSASFVQDVQSAASITTDSTSTPQCGTGNQVLGLQWNSGQTVVSYVTQANGSTSSTSENLVRQYCTGGNLASPATSTVSYDFKTTQPTAISVMCGSTACSGVGAGWISTNTVTVVNFPITEPNSNYQYTLVGYPEANNTTNGAMGTPTVGSECGVALPNTGTYASTLCFIDFSTLNTPANMTSALSSGGLAMTVTVPGGYTMTFTLNISYPNSSEVGPVDAVPFPSYSAAFLGNDIGGTPFYSGVGCPSSDPTTEVINGNTEGTPSCIDPAIYQLGSDNDDTTQVTLSNIAVTAPSGQPASGYEVVTTDAETTDPNEFITWNSNLGLNLIPNTPTSNEGDACNLEDGSGNPEAGGTDLTGVGSTPVTCSSTWQTPSNVPRTGTVMLGVSPTSTSGSTLISATFHGAGLQGVAFGLLLP
jgi:hypothetical protein